MSATKTKSASSSKAKADKEKKTIDMEIDVQGAEEKKAAEPVQEKIPAKVDQDEEDDEEDDEDMEDDEDEDEDDEDGEAEEGEIRKKKSGRKKERRTGDRAVVNAKLHKYAKEYGLRAAKTGGFIEQWIRANLRYFETEDATCFDSEARDRDLGDRSHGVAINYTFVNTKCNDVPIEHRKLVHRRLSAVVQDGVATACQLCLNTNKRTLSHKILKPALDQALKHMLSEPVQNPMAPIVVTKRKRAVAASSESVPTKKIGKEGPAAKKIKVAA